MRQTETFKKLEASLVPGKVYRRADLAVRSSNIDRHLARLVEKNSLKKLSQGMYVVPKMTVFGTTPPDADSLLRAFLKDDHFVVYGPSQFNALGLGTTQLYNQLIVFNRKRVGEFNLGGRMYTFHRWREAPKQLTQEFLVVALLNHLDELAEDRAQVLSRLKSKLHEFNERKLHYAATHYGTLATQKRLANLMSITVSGTANT